MLVEVLRLIDQNQRETSRYPLADGFEFSEAMRPAAHGPSNSFRAAACSCIVCVIRLLRRAASVRANTSNVWQSKRLRKSRVLAKARVQAAARAVHEGERQELVARRPALRPARVRPRGPQDCGSCPCLPRPRRSRTSWRHKPENVHGSRSSPPGMRAKSGVLAFAGSRSTSHRALSNCAARVRQAALDIRVTAALSWVGA